MRWGLSCTIYTAQQCDDRHVHKFVRAQSSWPEPRSRFVDFTWSHVPATGLSHMTASGAIAPLLVIVLVRTSSKKFRSLFRLPIEFANSFTIESGVSDVNGGASAM